MSKKSVIAGLFLAASFAISASAAATDQPTPNEEPQDTIYCIRDFNTGQLLCLVVPDPDPGPIWA